MLIYCNNHLGLLLKQFIYQILLWIVYVPGYSVDYFRAAEPS